MKKLIIALAITVMTANASGTENLIGERLTESGRHYTRTRSVSYPCFGFYFVDAVNVNQSSGTVTYKLFGYKDGGEFAYSYITTADSDRQVMMNLGISNQVMVLIYWTSSTTFSNVYLSEY